MEDLVPCQRLAVLKQILIYLALDEMKAYVHLSPESKSKVVYWGRPFVVRLKIMSRENRYLVQRDA